MTMQTANPTTAGKPAPDAKDFEAVFTPKNIAVIGATESPGAVGRTVVENLLKIKFPGGVFPVNPKRPTILGLKAYPNIAAVPEKCDLAVIITPAATVAGVIRECGDAGVRACIIISAGFKETSTAGLELEKQVVQAARESGVRFIGPNCLGVVNLHANLNASFAPSWPPAVQGFI